MKNLLSEQVQLLEEIRGQIDSLPSDGITSIEMDSHLALERFKEDPSDENAKRYREISERLATADTSIRQKRTDLQAELDRQWCIYSDLNDLHQIVSQGFNLEKLTRIAYQVSELEAVAILRVISLIDKGFDLGRLDG